MSAQEKMFVAYDERAAHGNPDEPDEASVLSSARTMAGIKRDIDDLGYPGVIFEYDVAPPKTPGGAGQLVNQIFHGTYQPRRAK